MFRILIAALLAVLTFSCTNDDPGDSSDSSADLRAKAVELARKNIIVDGHIDVPYRLVDEMDDITDRTAEGDFDYPRARKGALDLPFMSIYIPARYQAKPGASKSMATYLIAMMDSIVAANKDKFAPARSLEEVKQNFDNGLISFAYGMENGSGIEDDLQNVKFFYDKGVRYITLTHAKMNQICDSSYDSNKGWNGLSPFGREVVTEMNRVGIIVDISHVSDSTFYQVLRLTKTPVICSHSSARAFTPGWERNVNDDMLRAVAKNGGVVMINFGSAFLTEEANRYNRTMFDKRNEFMASEGITNRNDPAIEQWQESYRARSPYPYATVDDVVRHIDHVVRIAGIDHVGLGSDFDGVGDSLPTGLKSVADYPELVYKLLESGYSEEDVEKILGENALRVWRAVQEYAAESS